MSLKFTVAEDMGGYSLFVDTAQTNIEVGATEDELRRLLIDLTHELDVEQSLSPGSAHVDTSTEGSNDAN